MCEDCFQEQIHKFESETPLHQFEDILKIAEHKQIY